MKFRQLLQIGLLFMVSLCIVSCSNPHINEHKRNCITLIVNNAPSCDTMRFLSGGVGIKYDLSFMKYIDDEGKLSELHLSSANDTIYVESQRDYVELRYKYNMMDRYFLAANGDTVYVNFDSLSEPSFISSSSEELTRLYNIQTTAAKRRFNYNLMAHESINTSAVKVAERIKKMASANDFSQSRLSLEYINIDTLKSYINDFTDQYSAAINNATCDNYYRKWLEYQLWIVKKNISDLNYSSEILDSHANFVSYHTLLQEYYQDYRKRKGIPTSAIVNDCYIDPNGMLSYKMMFDSLRVDVSIPPVSKLIMLEHAIEGMRKDMYADLEYYQNIYVELGGKIKDRAESIEYNEFNTLELLDSQGKNITLQDVIAKNLGSVIYIDFWATTCGPCLAAMPSGIELREKLKGQDIIFVYISAWDKESVWRAQQRSVLGKEGNYQSYLATNFSDSKMIADFKISSIPRYMIFNKKGEFINDMALSPLNENAYDALFRLSPR